MNVNMLLERSRLLLAQGRYKDAEIAVKQVLESEPENEYALSILARCFMDSKRIDEGIEITVKALAINPQNSYYYYLLGYGHYQKNRKEPATLNLHKAINLDPYHPEYYGLLAYVLLDKNEFQEALQTADDGLAIDAENITCLNARSVALNKLKRTNDAIETMKGALARDPENEMTHTTAGWNYLEKGRQKEATGHFVEALRINPNYSNAQTGLKEALKSNVPPYKWLLQYSFWVRTKGRRWQRGLPIALFIVFRVFVVLFNNIEQTDTLAFIFGGIYILLIVTSWTINSIANFFLLFHRLGKHALNNSEKWSAVTVVASLLSGIAALILSSLIKDGENLLISGIVFISLALPLGRLHYPISIYHKDWKHWYKLGLLTAGSATLLFIAVLPTTAIIFFGIYMVALVVYTWIGAFA